MFKIKVLFITTLLTQLHLYMQELEFYSHLHACIISLRDDREVNLEP